MTDEEKYCETCNHIEMCKWTPISGCAFHSKHEQRPHGEWIIRRDKRGKHIYSVCSRCNVAHLDTDFPNFCPNCGSDNRPKEGEAE